LRIQVDREGSTAAHRKILCKMRGCGGLSRATFEIHDGNNLKLLAISAMQQITPVASANLVKVVTDLMNILDIECR